MWYRNNLINSLLLAESPLLLCGNDDLLVNWKALSRPNFFNNDFCRVRREYITLTMVLELLLSHRDEEGVVVKDFKSVEHKLRVSDTARLAADLFVEDKTLDDRD